MLWLFWQFIHIVQKRKRLSSTVFDVGEDAVVVVVGDGAGTVVVVARNLSCHAFSRTGSDIGGFVATIIGPSTILSVGEKTST